MKGDKPHKAYVSIMTHDKKKNHEWYVYAKSGIYSQLAKSSGASGYKTQQEMAFGIGGDAYSLPSTPVNIPMPPVKPPKKGGNEIKQPEN